MFHSAGKDVRARIGSTHPVPAKALVGFECVRVVKGGSVPLRFELGQQALELVNATGGRQLYPGVHTLFFSRGHGEDVAVDVTV